MTKTTLTFVCGAALLCCACGDDFAPFGAPGGAGGGGGDGGGGAADGGAAPGGHGPSAGPGGAGGGGGALCVEGEGTCDGETRLVCVDGAYVFAEDCAAGAAACVAGACERDLLALLRFEEGRGTVTVDESPTGLVGQLAGGSWVAGHRGMGVYFGPGARVDLGNALQALAFPVTLAAWAKIDAGAVGLQPLVVTEASAEYAGVWMAVDASGGGLLTAAFGNGGGGGPSNRNSKTALTGSPTDTWVHFAAVISGPANVALYVDGELVDGTYGGSAQQIGFTPSPVWVGNAAWSGAADWGAAAALDDVRIYGRALAPPEVAALAEVAQ